MRRTRCHVLGGFVYSDRVVDFCVGSVVCGVQAFFFFLPFFCLFAFTFPLALFFVFPSPFSTYLYKLLLSSFFVGVGY